MTTETTPILLGYRMTEKLYDGTRTLIYRGQRETDQNPVVIKFLKHEYPSFKELVQFRNQYTISKNLDFDGILHPYSLEKYQNGFALVMEDMGGMSLSEYVKSYSLGLESFFRIALKIVQALEVLYQNRIIHKDIKPQNILIHPKSFAIKLIDFSISSLLPRETQELQSVNVLEGTLAYISPEQTGRMNRGIDYRTDFYSLGVTFYELLSGQLPFQATEPMELVHCHIAKTPLPLVEMNSQIPLPLSDIVMKLMAKTAEERYQSTFGIKNDLEQCQLKWQQSGTISAFPLGQRDISDRFYIPEKLYGREAEVALLLEAFDRISEGTSEMMLVAGFSGIGKTALVNEVHKPIVRQRGYFIKGKFDQFKRNIPFSALVQAFQTLIQQLLTESMEQIETWKTLLLEALGDNAQVLIEVIPELEQMLGPQPSVPELEGSAAQNRFNRLFQQFINVFTTAEHPLVIFVDDLQWIDSASLKLIQLLMNQTDSHYLLLMGAYRDNEVSATHPLILTLDEIRKTDALVNQITLGPLEKPALNRLIADTLSCPPENAMPLTQLVIQKTQGNPFFTNQFLKFLHEEQLIAFDFACGYWQCDIAQVKQLAISDDVVEFMALQLQKLPIHTQYVLKLAACIGNQFDLATLAIVYEKFQADTAADLWKALQEGMIIPISYIYKFFQYVEENKVVKTEELTVPYKFLHDRVQQAAYSLIPEEQKASTHLKIGQLLKSHTREKELEENLFDIVNQLNQGVILLTNQAERDELAKLNLQAGHKAKVSTAYSAANKYLTVGVELLSNSSWQNQYDLTLALYDAATEAAYLSGNFSLQAQLGKMVLECAKTMLDKVKTYEIQIQVHLAKNQQIKALELASVVLKQLGTTFPEQPSQTDVEHYLQETQLTLEGKPIESLCHLPIMTDKNHQAVMRILSLLLGPSYEVAPNFFMLIACKQVQLSIKYGNTPESAFGYACFAILQVAVVNDIETAYQFGQLALNVVETLKAKEPKAKVCDAVEGCVNHWKIHFRKTLATLQEGYQSGLETGDFEYAGYCGHIYCANSYYSGLELTTLEREIASYCEAFRQLKQEIPTIYNEIFQQGILNFLEPTENPGILMGSVYNEEQMLPLHHQNNDLFALYYVYFNKIFLSYVFQEYPQTIEYFNTAKLYTETFAGFGATSIIYLCEALARLAVYPDSSKEQQQAHLEKVQASQDKMHNWAGHAPMNHQHKFDLVEAERLRVLGQPIEAMEYYDKAIKGAQKNQYQQEEALANELAGRFYMEWGKEQVAQAYLTEAYYGYARWGAKAKVEDLETRYPSLLAFFQSASSTSLGEIPETINYHQTTVATVTVSSTDSSLDLSTALKASQAISTEIHLDKLLETLIRVLVENAGAETGILMLKQDKQWVIEAQLKKNDHISTDAEVIVCQSQVARGSGEVPMAIVNYVSRTGETQVIQNAQSDLKWGPDPYIQKHQPKSVLCTQILNQDQPVAMLYLENNLSTSAFTQESLEVLIMLLSQAAISLENALKYQALEDKVKQCTDQLAQANEEIRALNEQLNKI
jgi:predicted ATPase/GAF domain-containing protein